MTTDLEALARAVVADPADDTVRLAYADELEGMDEPGSIAIAEYIREAIANPEPILHRMGEAAVDQRNRPGQSAEFIMLARATPGIAWATWRGFVYGVRGTLDTLAGGLCTLCMASGTVATSPYRCDVTSPRLTCAPCSGSGSNVGLLRVLVQLHPLEWVGVTDREPYPGRLRSTRGKFGWYPESGNAEPENRLPIHLFHGLINCDNFGEPGSHDVRWYASDESARADLSRTLLEDAGSTPLELPPVPPETLCRFFGMRQSGEEKLPGRIPRR